MTPVQAAFIAIIGTTQAPLPCPMPHEGYNSEFIVSSCSQYTEHGNRPESCYAPPSKAIYLPTSCKDAGIGDSYCNKLACHEAKRYVDQVCFKVTYKEPEPKEVIAAEGCLN
jgi:hypothetical protein